MPAQPNADAGAGRAGRDERAPPQPAARPVDGAAIRASADTAAQLRSPSGAPPPHAPLDEAASGAAGPAAMPGAAAAGAGAAVAGEGPEHDDGQVGLLVHQPLDREVLGADRRLDQAGHVAVQHCAVPTTLDELGKGGEDLEGAGLEAERATTAARGGHGTAEIRHLVAAERAEEMLMMGLRLRDGIDVRRFSTRTGLTLAEAVRPGALKRLTEGGFLACDENTLCTTERGRALLNSVLSELFA